MCTATSEPRSQPEPTERPDRRTDLSLEELLMRFRHILSETRAGLAAEPDHDPGGHHDDVGVAVAVRCRPAGQPAGRPDEGPLVRQDRDLGLPVHQGHSRRPVRPRPGRHPGPEGRDPAERWRPTRRSRPDGIYFETKEEAYAEFQQAYEGSPIQDSLTVDQMQESFRVKLKNPEQYQGVVSSVVGLKGVQKVQDLHQLLDPFFRALNVLQWSTGGASVLLLLASALQIGNTIRLATFARRREIGIMRLVGASNFYITVPFLLEAVFSAFIGIALACATLAAGVVLLGHQRSRAIGPVRRLDRLAADRAGDARHRLGGRGARGRSRPS